MSDQRVFKFGTLTFDDGSTISVPPIASSANGWVYRPDQLRTKQEIASGRNRAWSRGSGFGPAEVWMQEYFERQITTRDWEVPTKIAKTVEEPIGVRGNTDSLAVDFYLEPWGWSSISLELTSNRDTYGRTVADTGTTRTLEYRLTIHELGLWYIKKVVGDVHAQWARGTTAYISSDLEMDTEDVRTAVLNWIKDPWQQTVDQLRKLPYVNRQRLNEIVDPVGGMFAGLTLRNLKYDPHTNESVDGMVITNSAGKVRFYQKGEVQRVMTNDAAWNELQKIFDVYRFLGYDIRIAHGYVSGVQADTIKSITIEVPATEGANELGHRIILDAVHGEISFSCGFQEDEDKWLHRQTRLAQTHMGQLEEDLFTEYTIETKET